MTNTSIIDATAIVQSLRAAGEDDEQLIADMVEGETDFHGFMQWLLNKERDEDMLQDGIFNRIKALQERKAASVARKERFRAAMLDALNTVGIAKVTLPEATISRIAVKPSVVITDEALLPESCIRIKREADKTAIKKEIDAGNTVAGATLSNGGETIMVRTK
jgi:Siphovirus Gp157